MPEYKCKICGRAINHKGNCLACNIKLKKSRNSRENTWQDFFPHNPRFGQAEICDFVSRTIAEKKTAVVEAPYGIGKTASMLAAGLASGKKIIFAACDHAVQDAIVKEILNINEKISGKNRKLTVAAIIGKEHMCPHLHHFNYEACDFEKIHRRCPFFKAAYKKGRISQGISEETKKLLSEISDILKNNPNSLQKKNFVNFVIEKCTSAGLCPYEFMLELAARADVVILDYFHVFTPILNFMKKRVFLPEKSILFIDEADRLKDRLLDILTREISDKGLQRLKSQIKKMMKKTRPKTLDDFKEQHSEEAEDRNKNKNISHAEWLVYLRFTEVFNEFIAEKEKNIMVKNRKNISNEKEAYIDINKQEFIDFCQKRLYDFDEIINKISLIVEKLTDSESGYKKAVLRLDDFLKSWKNFSGNYFGYILLKDMKKYLAVSPYELCQTPLIEEERLCLADILKSFYSSILFSATIGNIDIFAEALGIINFESFFSQEFNTQDYMVILKKNISSVYRERQLNVGKVVHDMAFCKKTAKNVLISFPSYDCCNSVLHHLNAKSIQDAGSEQNNAQKQKNSSSNENSCNKDKDIFDEGFDNGIDNGIDEGIDDGIYYVVIGGKGSRGINKAAGLNTAYIYGLQLAKPDDYLFNKRKEFCLKKYGQEKAFKLLYNDVVNKSCQTAGRIFRNAGKKGLVVLADRRYKYDFRLKSFFHECIPSYFKVKMIETMNQEGFENAVLKFWQNN